MSSKILTKKNKKKIKKPLLLFYSVVYSGMKITLDEIIEFTDSNGYEIIDEAWNGILYRGSDGEEVYEDEIIEMIEEKKKKDLAFK
mgnify:CR=1 FL=1